MAKKMYAVVDNTLRKVRKGYSIVDQTVRKVRKGYTVVGGKVRPFWSSSGELKYFGSSLDGAIEGLTLSIDPWGAASTSKYAVFAGGPGYSPGNLYAYGPVGKINAYTKMLIHIESIPLMVEQSNVEGATIGNKALFASGVNGKNQPANYAYTNTTGFVYSVSNELTTTLVAEGDRRTNMGATSTDQTAIFAGGKYYSFNTQSSPPTIRDSRLTVLAYDADLTQKYLTYLPNPATAPATISNHGIILVAGGTHEVKNESKERYDPVKSVVAYDKELIQHLLSDLNFGKDSMASAKTGKYFILAGGQLYSGSSAYRRNDVEIYNTQMTKIQTSETISKDGRNRYEIIGASFADVAIFVPLSTPVNVDKFDSKLTHTVLNFPNEARGGNCNTVIGDFLLFAGNTQRNTSNNLTETDKGTVRVYTS